MIFKSGMLNININGDTIQTQIQANNRVMFTFRQRTRLTWNSTVDIDVNIECEALQIGEKYFVACHLFDPKYKDSPKYQMDLKRRENN